MNIFLTIPLSSDLPISGPHIRGLRSSYQLGDKINLTCESDSSSPRAQLNWYINNDLGKDNFIQEEELGGGGARLGLIFQLRKKHLQDGDLHLKCTAQVGSFDKYSFQVDQAPLETTRSVTFEIFGQKS